MLRSARSCARVSKHVAATAGAACHAARRIAASAAMLLSVRAEFLLHRIMRRDGDRAGAARAVAPGVVGATLHHGIAGRKLDLLGVEHQGDLALQDQAEI